MHPEIAKTLVAHHRDELAQDAAAAAGSAAAGSPGGTSAGRGPCWPRPSAGLAGANRAGQAGRRGSSLVIIISAHRSA